MVSNVVLQKVVKLVDSRVLNVVVVFRDVANVVLNEVDVLRDVFRDAAAEVVTVVLRLVGKVVDQNVVYVVVVFLVELVLVNLSVSTFVENSLTLLKPNKIITENHRYS